MYKNKGYTMILIKNRDTTMIFKYKKYYYDIGI